MPPFPFRDHWLVGILVATLVLTAGVLFRFSFLWVPWVALAVGVGAGILRARLASTGDVSVSASPVAVPNISQTRWTCAGLVAIALLQAIALLALFHARTDEAIAAPWQVLPTSLFALFGLSVFLLLMLDDGRRARTVEILWMAQAVLAFCVSAIVYRLGFGFDPFIHQAAARALVERGSIELTSILYAGQYAFVAGLARITGAPVGWIDRALVPVLAVALVGWIFPRVVRAWGIERPTVGTRVLFFLPFLPLTFTVPYQLTYLGLIFVIMSLPWLATRAGLLLAVLTLVGMGTIHPLLAIPAGLLIACGWLASRSPRWAGVAGLVLTFGGLLGAFYFYVTRLGGVMAIPTAELWRVAWQALTAFPYRLADAPVAVGAFYRFFHLWPFLFALAGLFGMRALPPMVRPFRWVYVGVAGGLLLTAFTLAASTRFTDILSTEQFEFALRLRYAFPLFFVPMAVAALESTRERLPVSVRPALFAVLTMLATGVWHLSYPQANRYLQMSGPGLSRADIEAVRTIERIAAGRSYVALTPQMVSAAALDQLGFERELQTSRGKRYAYAIPTGGEFYQQYLRLWREPDVTRILAAARSLSGQERVFIVVPRAWDPSSVLSRRLLSRATRAEPVGETMTVYFFE